MVEALRYKPESRGSIPDSVIGDFRWHNPSGRTMALGLTQPLTPGNITDGKGGRCVRQTALPPSCAFCFEIYWNYFSAYYGRKYKVYFRLLAYSV